MTVTEWATMLVALGGGGGIALIVKALRPGAKRAGRVPSCDPPPKDAARALPPPPLPVTRVEHEALAHKVAVLEDVVRKLDDNDRKHSDAARALDRRIDKEVEDRLRVDDLINKESAHCNEKLAEITGRLNGYADAGMLPARRRRS